MKTQTIEQRSVLYAEKTVDKDLTYYVWRERLNRVSNPVTPYGACKNDYRHGAEEQREIDIDKAYELIQTIIYEMQMMDSNKRNEYTVTKDIIRQALE